MEDGKPKLSKHTLKKESSSCDAIVSDGGRSTSVGSPQTSMTLEDFIFEEWEEFRAMMLLKRQKSEERKPDRIKLD